MDYEKIECCECWGEFYAEEINYRGVCERCENKLNREYARDIKQLENEYWGSRF